MLELLIVFIILIILIGVFWSYSTCDKKTIEQNFLKLKKLQYALYLARSEAVRLRTKVYLCPSHNQKTCCHDWASNIMIWKKDGEQLQVLHYLAPIFIDPLLRFKFFGNQADQIIIFLPNGLTINNGHFCTDVNLICLYLNKAGKIYIKVNPLEQVTQ